MLSVQRLVDLIKQVEGGGVTLLDGEDEGQRHQGLLAPRQLLHLPHLTLLPREGHLQAKGGTAVRGGDTGSSTGLQQLQTHPDAYAGKLVDGGDAALGAGAPLTVSSTSLALILRLAALSVALLHHQSGLPTGHQLLEDLREVLGHLQGAPQDTLRSTLLKKPGIFRQNKQ